MDRLRTWLEQIDAEKRNKISEFEFVASVQQVQDPLNASQLILPALSPLEQSKLKSELINKLLFFELSPEQFFKQIDNNDDQRVSFYELRSGLLSLGFNLAEARNLVQVLFGGAPGLFIRRERLIRNLSETAQSSSSPAERRKAAKPDAAHTLKEEKTARTEILKGVWSKVRDHLSRDVAEQMKADGIPEYQCVNI